MADRFSSVPSIARKEFRGFFATPAAYLFLGGFLAVTLFVFFWVETFFARNIADVRPLFQWLPVLLIFLVAALTMRAWSEERRSGTLESLLTAPVKPLELILGKFVAALGLVALALALGLATPIAALAADLAVDGAVDEEETRVDGAALGGVAGLGVSQLEMLGDVLSGEPDAAGTSGDGDAAVVVDGGDAKIDGFLHKLKPR